MRAIVLGGSGNVGSRLVSQLCSLDSPYSHVTLLSRRSLPQFDNFSSKISIRILSNFNQMEEEIFEKHDVAFMLQGIGKPSQVSQEELEKIDYLIPVQFAKACLKSGVQHISILSAIGADSTQEYSWITKTGAGG